MPQKAAVASAPKAKLQIGDQIRKQREAMKMTIAVLAKKMGISRNTITNYESGHTEPTASELLNLSFYLGCSLADLLHCDSTTIPPRFAFRAHAPLRQNPTVIAKARKFLRAYDEIETLTESRLKSKLKEFEGGFKSPIKDREIEMAANTLRHESGFHDAGPENITGVLEHLGVRTLFFEYDGKGLEGISTIQGDMPLVMLRRRKKVVERTIFSAAHELGHLVLHPHLFSNDEKDEGVDGKVYEVEANKFAGYFLVPTEELMQMWKSERLEKLSLFNALLILKRVFRVSFHCLYYRVAELGLHPKVDMGQFTMEIKRHLGITGPATMEELEPDPLHPDVLYDTTRFSRLVQSAFLQKAINESKVGQLFQITLNQVHEITSEWLRPKHELVDDCAL